MILVTPALTTAYVSSVSANGIPVGSDATGIGTAAAPFLTANQAVKSCGPTATILFNGDPASPPTYILSANITTALTLKSTVPGSKTAILTGANTTAALILAPTGGQTITIQDLIVDASLASGGAAASVLQLATQSTTYSVVVSNCTLRNWTTHGIVPSTSTSNKVNLTLTNVTLTADAVQSAVRLIGHAAGSLSISGGSTIITNQSAAYTPVIYASATATGTSATITNHTMSVGVDNTLVGANTHFGALLENYLGAVISGGTYGMTTTAASRQCNVVGIATGVVSGGGSQLSINGSQLGLASGSVLTVTHNAPAGGVLAYINQDSTGIDPTKAQDCIIENVAASGIGLAHGLFVDSTQRAIIRNSSITNVALGVATKLASATTITGITGSDCTSTYCQWKGSSAVVQSNNTWTAHATYTGPMLTVQTAPEDSSTCTGTVTGDHFIVNGAAAITLVAVNASNSATFVGNDYHLTSGSVAANPWTYQGTGYSTFSAWQAAHAPTDTSNIA